MYRARHTRLLIDGEEGLDGAMAQRLRLQHCHCGRHPNAIVSAERCPTGAHPLAIYISIDGLREKIEVEVAVALGHHVQVAL